MSWKIVYHYPADEREVAESVFDGVARAYDRADRLELISPENEVVDTIYVTEDAAREAGFTRGEDGRGVRI